MTVLVLRALGLGDFVTGLPALALLREARPDDEIVLAAPQVFEPVLPLVGTVDRLVHAHELAPIDGLPERPDLAVDLHGNGPASRDLLRPAHPRRVLAFADGPVRWRADEHEVVRWQRLLTEGLGLPVAPARTVAGSLGIPPPADVPAGVTVVHCGAASAARRWPPVRLATVALLLAAEGHHVVVTGGPAERDLAESIAAAAGVEARHDLSLLDLLALVGRARLVVSGDTGVAHVAAAYRIPSVTLFGPVSPARWGPPGDDRHQVIWHGAVDGSNTYSGDPHGATLDPALARVTVADVMAAVARAERPPATSASSGRALPTSPSATTTAGTNPAPSTAPPTRSTPTRPRWPASPAPCCSGSWPAPRSCGVPRTARWAATTSGSSSAARRRRWP